MCYCDQRNEAKIGRAPQFLTFILEPSYGNGFGLLEKNIADEGYV